MQSEKTLLRKAVFIPCNNKESLRRWICVYLGLNFPDTIVDPDSNSSPMDVIWEIYDKARKNDDPHFSRILAFAARDSGKTLAAAVLELLSVLHLGRDVAHMAALKGQSRKAQSYVKRFIRRPYIRDYATSSNTEMIEFCWYMNSETGDALTAKEFDRLPEGEKQKYTENARYITIVIATLAATNSAHVPFFCIDEIDVIPKQNQIAYEEAKSIPASFEGKEPITFLFSSRKFSFGNVQREIDQAKKSGLHVRHWNIIDVTERCPPTRHLPNDPKIDIYYRDDDFTSIGKAEYEALDPDEKAKYKHDIGYAGCLKNCLLFAACKTRLATHQKDHPKDERGDFLERPRPLLKSINFTTNKIKELTADMVKTQLLCQKPSNEALIYPQFDRSKHVLTAAQMAEKLTGEHHERMEIGELISLLKTREGRWGAGMDFGFTHKFSVILAYIDGDRVFIMGHWAKSELDPAETLELLDNTIRPFNPKIYADPEAPNMVKMLKKHGYRCASWKKGPGSVLGGIERIRFKLKPALGVPELFFLEGGDNIEELIQMITRYHWTIGIDGEPTKEPDEVLYKDDDGKDVIDDSLDALRYCVMNFFTFKGKPSADPDIPNEAGISSKPPPAPEIPSYGKQIFEHVFGEDDADMDLEQKEPKGHKGGVFWDMS